jgi:multidrug efflux system membrane fusion protein
MNRVIRRLIALGVLAVVPACQKVEGRTESPATPVRVEAAEAVPAPPSLRYSATVEADRVVTVAFQATGYIDAIAQRRGADGRMRALQPGDQIASGTMLARVREADYRARVNQAAGAVGEVEAALAKARLDRDRAQALFDTASLTKPELDVANAALAAAEAQLSSARAQAALAATALSDTEIVAPFAGVVIARHIEIGALVNPGSPAFVIARVTPVKAIVGVPDLHVGRIAPGRRLKVTTESAPGIVFDGIVVAIAASANDQNRLFNVEIALDNRNGELRPGMIAAVEIPSAGVPATPSTGACGAVVLDRPNRRRRLRVWRVRRGGPRRSTHRPCP